MNRLSTEKRAMILNLLVEGMSMRATSRVADVSINTVSKLLVDAGEACAEYHDRTVRMVRSRRVQCDEIWSFCYAKAKGLPDVKAAPAGAGSVWTWTALDADTKLILVYEVGDRGANTAHEFMTGLSQRLMYRVQLTTDGHGVYLDAVDGAFADNIDYAMLVKQYGTTENDGRQRYIGADVRPVSGSPDPAHISTSYVERCNLRMRMGMRRFTRRTNGFSKKIENHLHMLSLFFVHYNFVRIHKSLRVTPAMAAGLEVGVYDMEWIVGLIDARAPMLVRPKTYRRQISN